MIKGMFKKKATIRGMVRSLVIVVIIPTLFLSVLLYRTFYMRYYEMALSTNEAILNAISVSVEDNRKLVENVIEMFSYDILSYFRREEEAYSKQIQQVFKIQELIAERSNPDTSGGRYRDLFRQGICARQLLVYFADRKCRGDGGVQEVSFNRKNQKLDR